MADSFKEIFLENSGYRLCRDNISILLQSTAYGRRLSEEQLTNYSRALNKFIADIDNVYLPFLGHRNALTEADFPNLTAEPSTNMFQTPLGNI